MSNMILVGKMREKRRKKNLINNNSFNHNFIKKKPL